MSVDQKHSQYAEWQEHWAKCRDTAGGARSVKGEGEKYLPKLTAEAQTEYNARVTRAVFYGAMGRTIQGLSGAVHRRPAELKVPTTFEEYQADFTLTGIPFNVFARGVFDNVLTTGRVAVYVDAPDIEAIPGGADMGLRPYAVMVPGESVINWRWAWVPQAGRFILQWVVIKEMASAPKATPDNIVAGTQEAWPVQFDYEQHEQWRVLYLDYENLNEAGRPAYTVDVWRKDDKATAVGTSPGGNFVRTSQVVPRRLNAPLDFVPFQFFGPTNLTPDIEKPPLLDLAELNLAHYINSADYEHGLHFTGLPTYWVAGFPRDTTLRVGSDTAWVSDKEGASAGVIQANADNMGALQQAMSDKKSEMAALGARMLEQQKAGVEAARAIELRQSGETATLQGVATTTEAGLQKVAETMVWWGGGEQENAEVTFNKDVVAVNATPEQLTALTAMLQAGSISYLTFYYLLERFEMTRPGTTVEDEVSAINNDQNGVLNRQPPGTELSEREAAEIDDELKRIEQEA